MTHDPDTPWTGRLLGGRYLLGERLGSGGMGAVYAGVQQDLGRRVAIKVLLPHLAERPELITRFKREALAAAALGHPNIVQVTDFSDTPGEAPFIVMEHLEGETLGARLARETRLSAERVAFIAAQVLSALEAAHEAGIVHRDLKPENIFLTSIEGVPDVVKVLDFGLAKHSQSQEPTLTETGALMGTPAYMAPEQVEGGSITPSTDLYAVGAVMYRALSGRLPHSGDNHYALMYAIVQQRPLSIATLRPDLDEQLAFIVDRSMEKRPEDRFGSAKAMRVALSSLAPEAAAIPTPAPTPTPSPAADSAAPTLAAPTASAGADSAAPTVAGGSPHRPAPASAVAVPGQAAVPLPAFAGARAGTPGPGPTSPAGASSSGTGLKIVIAALCTIIVIGGVGAAWVFWPRESNVESTAEDPAAVAVVAGDDAKVEAAAAQVAAVPEAAPAPDPAPTPTEAPEPAAVAPTPAAQDAPGTSDGGLFGGFDPFGKDDAPEPEPADKSGPAPEPEPTPEPAPETGPADTDGNEKGSKKKKKNKQSGEKTDGNDSPAPEPSDDKPDPKTATGGTKPYLSSINAGKVLTLDAVKGTLNPVLPKVTSCYAKHEFSPGHHEFQGWWIHLDPDGNVTKVEKSGTAERCKGLDHCMNRIYRRLNFGPTKAPEGGKFMVTYTARLPGNP